MNTYLVHSFDENGDLISRFWMGEDESHVREQVSDAGDFDDETIIGVRIS